MESAGTQSKGQGETERPLPSILDGIGDAISIFDHEWRYTFGAVGTEIKRGKSPGLRVQEVHLLPLFQNLIGNAIKYRSPDTPAIEVTAMQNQDHWFFSVKDKGIGIDPQYIRSKSLDFLSASTPLKTIPEPASAFRFVKRSPSAIMGGSGSSLSPGEAPPSSSRSLPQDEPRATDGSPGPRIVLVEDNSADVHLIKEAFSEHRLSHALTVLRDGEKAIQYVEDLDSGAGSCPVLFIVDLNLPRRDGRDVLRRIRLSPRCAAVPIVILSSSGAEKDREEAKALGATLYIKKPSDLDQFLNIGEIIKRLLEAPQR